MLCAGVTVCVNKTRLELRDPKVRFGFSVLQDTALEKIAAPRVHSGCC